MDLRLAETINNIRNGSASELFPSNFNRLTSGIYQFGTKKIHISLQSQTPFGILNLFYLFIIFPYLNKFPQIFYPIYLIFYIIYYYYFIIILLNIFIISFLLLLFYYFLLLKLDERNIFVLFILLIKISSSWRCVFTIRKICKEIRTF